MSVMLYVHYYSFTDPQRDGRLSWRSWWPIADCLRVEWASVNQRLHARDITVGSVCDVQVRLVHVIVCDQRLVEFVACNRWSLEGAAAARRVDTFWSQRRRGYAQVPDSTRPVQLCVVLQRVIDRLPRRLLSDAAMPSAASQQLCCVAF